MHDTLPLLERTPFPSLRRSRLESVQVNLGYRCNQQCSHCHVNAGPRRTEVMQRDVIEEVLAFLDRSGVTGLDLTGGAPELNPHFRYLVEAARRRAVRVIDRCNLTVLEESGQEDLVEFLARHRVEVVASLPCYLEDNVDRQRGKGVFAASLAALQRLNAAGYGRSAVLPLNLVYNPQGPALPPPQQSLEHDYRRHLWEDYGIVFTRLYTIANMPIQRFGSTLVSKGKLGEYVRLLREAHRPENLNEVMCLRLISIDWQGYAYDCDFNQMLGLPLAGRRTHISELAGPELVGRSISVRGHCYGCTAGQGSSCGGALAA